MSDDGDLLVIEAVSRYLGSPAPRVERVPQGLSGASVYRCSAADRCLALKRWPVNTVADRVDEVHRVQRFAAQSLPFIPRLIAHQPDQYRFTLASTHFELSTWMPGSLIDPHSDPAPADAIKAGAAAIARFHQAVLPLGATREVAPAVLRRLERLREIQRELPGALPNATRIIGPVGFAAKFLAAQWRELHSESAALLRNWENRTIAVHWALRDIHREHILFNNGRVSGMVDFDAVRKDTMATDLARWVGSFADFGLDLPVLWEAVWAGYSSERAVSSCDQELASAIEKASWYIHLANWVIWVSGDPQNIPGGMEAAQQRVARLLRRSD